MKNTRLIFINISLSICFLFSSEILAQKIKGNGNITTQVRNVAEFEELELDGLFNVILIQSDTTSVTVEADENLQAYIIVENQGAKLRVVDKDEEAIKKFTKMNVYIRTSDLRKLNMDMVGKVSCRNLLKTSVLELSCHSTGSTSLNLEVQSLTAKIGSIGDMTLTGTVEDAKIEVNDKAVGNINAIDFKANKLTIKYSGVGGMDVYADGEISIVSDGVGHINYKGNASVLRKEATGQGLVKKIR